MASTRTNQEGDDDTSLEYGTVDRRDSNGAPHPGASKSHAGGKPVAAHLASSCGGQRRIRLLMYSPSDLLVLSR